MYRPRKAAAMAVFVAMTSMQVNGRVVPKSLLELYDLGLEFQLPSFPVQSVWSKGFLLKGPDDDIDDDVEDQVEDEIEDEVEDQVEDEIEDEVEDQVEDEIEDEVEDQVKDEIEDEVEDQVEHEIEDEVEDDIKDHVEDEIEDEAEERAKQIVQDELEDELEDKIKNLIEHDDADDDLEKVAFDSMTREVENIVNDVEREIDLIKELDGNKIFTTDWQVLSDKKSLDALTQSGFNITHRQYLAGLDLYLARLEAPDSYAIDLKQYDQVMTLNTEDLAIDVNHLYTHAQSTKLAEQPSSLTMTAIAPGKSSAHPIGIIDSAIMPDHEVFQLSQLHSKDFTESVGKSNVSHGTAIASILVGQSESYRGLLAGEPIWSASVFFNDASGESLAATTSIIQGLDWLVRSKVHIINMSLAGPENKLLETAIKRACDKHILIVAAAGNAGPTAEPLFPAAYRCTLAVTALDRQHQVYRRANRGKHIVAAAYGVKIRHAHGVEDYRYSSGTSYAAAFFSAWLAENLPSDNTLWQSWLDEQLLHFEDYGPKGKDEIYGFGAIPNQFGKHLLESN